MAETNVIKSLGAADLDTKELTTNLVNAIKEPRQKIIDLEKKKADVAISNLSLLKNALSTLKSAATEIGSVSKLNKLSLTSSDTSTATLTTAEGSSVALAGNYSLTVSQLARPQRSVSVPGYANSTSAVSSSEALKLNLTLAGTTKTVDISTSTTAAGLVSAINSAGLDVSARLINTNDGTATPYKIVLQGPEGVSNAFTMQFYQSDGTTPATSPPIFSTAATGGQTAQDSTITLNGLTLTRSSNSITDAISGVSINLLKTNTATATNLNVAFDGSALLTGVSNFVESVNLINDFIKRATGPKVEGDDIAGSLQGDATIKTVRSTIRSKLIATAPTGSGNVPAWSALGVVFNREGVLEFDQDKFTKKFNANPQDAITAICNNASSPYIYSGSPSGLAGDVAVAAHRLLGVAGAVTQLEESYQSKITVVEKKQTKLDNYIERITAQYEKQFAALSSILSEYKATSSRLTQTFERNNN